MFGRYEDIVTVDELMEMLLIGRNTAYHLLNAGKIKGFRYHRVWKIPKKSVIEYVERSRNAPFVTKA